MIFLKKYPLIYMLDYSSSEIKNIETHPFVEIPFLHASGALVALIVSVRMRTVSNMSYVYDMPFSVQFILRA